MHLSLGYRDRFAGEVSREIRWIYQFRRLRAVLKSRSKRETTILDLK